MTRFSEFLQAIVRPIVTLIFAIVTAIGWFMGRLSDDAFLGISGMVIAFWFQSRGAAASENGTSKPSEPPPVPSSTPVVFGGEHVKP